jgi:hypothetical protein
MHSIKFTDVKATIEICPLKFFPISILHKKISPMAMNKLCRHNDFMRLNLVITFDLSLDETSNNFVPNKQMLQPNNI